MLELWGSTICLAWDPSEWLAKIGAIAVELLPGFYKTLFLFFITLILSLPLGLLVAFIRTSRIAPLRWITSAYISIMRGTPLMLQLMVVFYGPNWLFGVNIGSINFGQIPGLEIPLDYRTIAAVIGFTINYAAYFGEIFRGGIASISTGQHEAGAVLGLTRAQTQAFIILPQMFRNVLPSITNEVVTLVKDTSLAQVIVYAEMYLTASHISASQSTIAPLFVAGLFYYVANYVVQFIMGHLEKRLRYYKS